MKRKAYVIKPCPYCNGSGAKEYGDCPVCCGDRWEDMKLLRGLAYDCGSQEKILIVHVAEREE